MPGLYGSNLFVTYSEWPSPWYCNKKQDNNLLWVDITYAIPPRYNCLFKLLTASFDDKTQKIIQQPFVHLSVRDFGGDEGMSKVDHGLPFDFHFVESFSSMFDYFKSNNYHVKEDLFGAPFDWRLAMAGLDDLYPKYKKLVEEVYAKNNNAKVSVLGYSLGGFVLQQFFSKKVDQEWKDKYIEQMILLCPAFGGAGNTLDVAWNLYFPIIPFLKNDVIAESVPLVPVISALFPNHLVFGNATIIKGPNTEINSSGLSKFFKEKGKVYGVGEKIFDANWEYPSSRLDEPGVPVYMIYNSKIETLIGMNFDKGFDQAYTPINSYGDGTVPKEGPEWVCNNWKNNNHSVVCFDVADKKLDHQEMSVNNYVHQLIDQAVNDPNWKSDKGNYFIVDQAVEFFNVTDINNKTTQHFRIRPDIRQRKTTRIF